MLLNHPFLAQRQRSGLYYHLNSKKGSVYIGTLLFLTILKLFQKGRKKPMVYQRTLQMYQIYWKCAKTILVGQILFRLKVMGFGKRILIPVNLQSGVFAEISCGQLIQCV